MKTRTLSLATIALAPLLTGCTPADTRDADAKTIRDTEAAWSQAYATKDADKITSFYADDASLFITGMPIVRGKANIASTWKQYLGDSNFSLTFTPDRVTVAKSGEMGTTQGSYAFTYTDPKSKQAVLEKGKYVEVYMKQADGSWKDVADISNADGPVVLK